MPIIYNPSLAVGRTARFRTLKRVAVDTQNLQTAIKEAENEVTDTAESAKQAKLDIDGLLNSVQTAKTKVSEIVKPIEKIKSDADAAKTAVVEINTNVLRTSHEIANILTLLSQFSFVKLFPFPKSFPDEQIESLWICERVLHRVEQIVTDKDIDKPSSNNDYLQQIKKDTLTGECKNVLTIDLGKEIDNIHRDFSVVSSRGKMPLASDVHKERYDRFVQIQQLRHKIVAYLLEKKQESKIQ